MVTPYPSRHPSSHLGDHLLPGRRSRSLWGGDLQPTDLSISPAKRRTIGICPHSNEIQHRPGRAGALAAGSIILLARSAWPRRGTAPRKGTRHLLCLLPWREKRTATTSPVTKRVLIQLQKLQARKSRFPFLKIGLGQAIFGKWLQHLKNPLRQARREEQRGRSTRIHCWAR